MMFEPIQGLTFSIFNPISVGEFIEPFNLKAVYLLHLIA